MKKKIIIITLAIVIILLASATILYFQEYSLLQINADNFDKRLKRNEEAIYKCGIDNCIPDNITLLHSDDLATSSNYKNNGFEIERIQTNPTRLEIKATSYHTDITYCMFFEKDKGAISAVFYTYNGNELFKQIVDKLILKEGFILKESELKRGRDIIIKETEDNFIIVEINGTYENGERNSIHGLFINTYSKRKYFQL